jgi:erythromycin esterase-like protein
LKKTITFLLLSIYFNTYSQSIKTQILNNVSEINSVNPNDTNFTDLQVIGNAVGDSKIVFLGEQDHGDATTFEAKTRIIKYLHEHKGFNIIAFESDFFNINKKSDEHESIDKIETSIFPIWSNCIQVNPLFDYIKNQQKTNPIVISGFDCQIAQNYKDDNDRTSYLETITKYIDETIDTSKIENYLLFQRTLRNLIFFVKATENKNAYFKKVDKTEQYFFFNTLLEIMDKIENKKTFLFKSLENSFYYARMAWYKKDGQEGRDIQMGKNILWLNNVKFKSEKIIIWAHSAHLIKKIYNKKGKRVYFSGNTSVSAGEYVSNKLNKKDIYSIGFASRKGETQRTSLNVKTAKYQIKSLKKNSFENWVFSKKMKFSFINFQDLKNNSEVFNMKGFSHHSFKANWLEAFDGIFYIDEISPCIREK